MAWSRSDDLDGTPAEQFLFGFDGQMYVIDLGEASREKMRKALQPFLTVAQPYGDLPEPEQMDPSILDLAPPPTPARRVPPTPKVARAPKSTKGVVGRKTRRKSGERVLAEKAGIVKPTQNGKPDFGAIRAWANANGYTVGPTGRIPAAILDAYDTQTSAL